MSHNEIEALKIFRLLTPEHQVYLLYLARSIYQAESSEQVYMEFDDMGF